MTYFAATHLGTGSSVMVTGSHNPPDYNGLKMVVAGDTLSGDEIQELRTRIERGDLATGAGSYRDARRRARRTSTRIVGDVKLARPMKIAVDCGNGVAGAFAPDALPRASAARSSSSSARSTALSQPPSRSVAAEEPRGPRSRACAQGDCELGLAFDGDGDRLGVVTQRRPRSSIPTAS